MHIDNFHYSLLGNENGEKIVFVHGLMAFAANWRKIANKLEHKYRCLIYDQRGHGRSFKPDNGYSPQDFADDLYKITAELGWDRFHLVGHSMGAGVATIFAFRYPERVKTLCIEDIGADVAPESFRYYENMLNIVPTPFNSKDELKSFFADEFLRKFTPKESPEVLKTFLQANIEEKPDGRYDWKFSKQAIVEIVRESHSRDRWLEVSSLKMPVLLVRGEKSHVLGADEYHKMLAVNPRITGVEIKGVGHWVHYEKFEEFTACLDDFIQKSLLHDA